MTWQIDHLIARVTWLSDSNARLAQTNDISIIQTPLYSHFVIGIETTI
jgi:hypothetical protein